MSNIDELDMIFIGGGTALLCVPFLAYLLGLVL